jgi:hypothetical protein
MTGCETDKTTVEDLRRMISARTRIQTALIELLVFKRNFEDQLKNPPTRLRQVGLLASAGFSLWRAAFLFTHGSGEADGYLKDVDKFIAKVVSDNMIGFSDDKNSWSLWHYIGVARSSLIEAASLFTPIVGPRGARLDNLLSEEGATHNGPFKQWDNLLEAMQTIQAIAASRHDFLKTSPKIF